MQPVIEIKYSAILGPKVTFNDTGNGLSASSCRRSLSRYYPTLIIIA